MADNDNPYVGLMGSDPAAAVTAAQQTPPSAAADAITTSQKTGIPPQAVLANPDAAKGMADGLHPATISQSNPQMARWSMGEPTQVAASLPHYEWMDGISKVFDYINKQMFPGPRPATTIPQAIGTEYRESVQAGMQNVIYPGLMPFASPRALASTIGGINAAMGEAFSPLTGTLTATVGQGVEDITGFNRRITGNVLAMLLPWGFKPKPRAIGPEPEAPPINVNLGPRPLPGPKGGPTPEPDIIDTTAEPVTEASPAPTHPLVEVAKNNAEVMDAVYDVIQQQEMTTNLPVVMNNFLHQLTDDTPTGIISINPQVALEAYKDRMINGLPAPDQKDGILGWVPDIQTKAVQALLTGQDLKVPTADYLTNVSPEGHALLRDGLSFGDGRSVADAELFAKMPAAEVSFKSTLEGLEQGSSEEFKKSPLSQAQYPVEYLEAKTEQEEQNLRAKRDAAHKNAVETVLPIDRIYGTEKELGVRGLTSPSEELPVVEKAGGKYIVFDGNHRIAAAKLRGEKNVKVKLANVDAEFGQERASATVEQAIAKARQENYLTPLFKDAEAIGMSEPQFKLYAQAVQKADEAFKEKVIAQQSKQMRLEQNKEWRAEADRRVKDAWHNVAQDRAVRARFLLATGEDIGGDNFAPVKLDRKSVAKSYPDIIKELPRDLFGENGVEPDDIAEALGFRHGEQMLREIADLERLRNTDKFITGEVRSVKSHTEYLVEQELSKLVGQKLGNFLSPEQLDYAARLGVSSKGVQNLLIEELQALAQKAGLPFSKPTMEAAALDAFRSMPVKEAVNLKALERVVGRGGRETEVALLKKKYPEAFQAKQRQFIATRILGHATDFQKTFVQADRRFRAIARHPVIASTDQHYVNYVHDALMQAGYRVKRSPRELASALEGVTLPEFVLGKERGGYSIYYNPWQPGPVRDMTVEDFESMRNTIKSLLKVGRDEKTIYVQQQKLDLQALVDEAAAQRAQFGEKWTQEELHEHHKKVLGPQQTVIGGLRKAFNLRALDASAVVPEFLVDELDMNNFHGVYNRVVMQPAQDAKHALDELSERVANKFLEFNKQQPKEWSGTLEDPVDVPYHYFDKEGGMYLPIKNRGDLLGAAIHWGNTENQYKLVESGLKMSNTGEKITHEDMQRAFDYYMRKEDWDFVQHLWDTSEELWNMARDMHGRMSGVKPPNVEPQGFEAHGVQYKGGHAPIFYDALLGRDVRSVTPADALFGDDYLRSLPSKGYSIKRNTYTAPLEMDIDLYRIRYAQMILDITHREAIVNMRKFLSHPEIRRGLNKMIGPEYTQVLTALPNRIANARMLDDRNAKFLNDLAKLLRRNIVVSEIGFKLSTIEKHGPTALMKSINEVGMGEFWNAVHDLSKGNLLENWKKEIAESPELQRRIQTMDRDMATQLTKLTAKHNIIQTAQDWSTMGVGMSDLASTVPTYRAAKNKALREGETMEDAIKIGEKAVRKAHGAGAHIDLPMILDPQGEYSELLKTFTVFTTFLNNSYNVTRNALQLGAKGIGEMRAGELAKGGRKFTKAFATIAMVAYISSAYVLKLEGAYHKGESLMKKFAKTLAWGLAGGLPLANSVIRPLIDSTSDFSSNIFDQVGKSTLTTANDSKKLIENAWAKITGHSRKLLPPKMVQHTLITAGDIFGIPGAAQASKPAQYLADTAAGRAHPHGFGGFLRDLWKGK